MEYPNLMNVIETITKTWYLDTDFLWWKSYIFSSDLQEGNLKLKYKSL